MPTGAPTQRKWFCENDLIRAGAPSPMPTQNSQGELGLGSSGGRKRGGAFDGIAIASNVDVVLLAAADQTIGLSLGL